MSQGQISTDIKRNPLNARILVYPTPPPINVWGGGEEHRHVYAEQIGARIIPR